MLRSQRDYVLEGKGVQLELDHVVSSPSWTE